MLRKWRESGGQKFSPLLAKHESKKTTVRDIMIAREMVAIRKLQLYLETTLFNYYFDEKRDGHTDTVKLFEAIGRGEYEAYTSEYVVFELKKTKEPKRSNMLNLSEMYNIHNLDVNPEAERLAEVYLDNGVIPARYWFDSVHIAISSIHGLDCVVSYNFEHINPDLKQKYWSKGSISRKITRVLLYAHPRRCLIMNYNSFEEELDAIRLEIYEEIKDMTYEERAAYIKAETAPIHEKYGIHTISEVINDELINA